VRRSAGGWIEERPDVELNEYAAALRRFWRIWVGSATVGVLAALGIVLSSTPTYQAQAEVFVAGTGEGTSGAQFVNQRVSSYPQVARSRTVLHGVIDDLGLRESLTSLRQRIGATNPPDTSQIDITVSDSDPDRAAEITNAVAVRFGAAIEELERPVNGESPVQLSVTDPATTPSTPDFPVPALILGLGTVVGLILGAAGAILRSRLDTGVYDADDVRAVWGHGEEPTVHAAPMRRRGTPMTARPAQTLARQLELLAETGPVRVLAVPPAPRGERRVRAFLQEVAADLVEAKVAVGLTDALTRRNDCAVQLTAGSPAAPMRDWRRIARDCTGVVLVAERGRLKRGDLAEIRALLSTAGARPLAVVLLPKGRARTDEAPPVTAPRAAQPSARREAGRALAGRR